MDMTNLSDFDSDVPDELLAEGAATGRLHDFEALLHRYRHRVYRVCYWMAGNAEEAQDWTQKCFVRLYEQLGSYDPTRPFAPWLWRVVSNTCLNLVKARSRRHDQVELVLEDERGDVCTAVDPMPAACSREEARRVRTAVEALPPPLRQALLLRVLEGLSFREIAGAQGVPLQTAASWVRRALTQVKKP